MPLSVITGGEKLSTSTLSRNMVNYDPSSLFSRMSKCENHPASLKSLAGNISDTHITVDLAENTHVAPSLTGRMYLRLVKIMNFFQDWGPNQLIAQLGPQIKIAGTDLKMTSTLVLSASGVQFYPVHTEIGKGFDINSRFAKGYALLVKQFGIEFNWWTRTLTYNRQQLARIELDVPTGVYFGIPDMQFTLGLEVGTTNQTTTLARSVQHAFQDLITILPAKGILLTQAYRQAGIIGPLIGLLATPAVLDGLIEGTLPGASERVSSLWAGFSFGYGDINSTITPNINITGNEDQDGVNLIMAFYTRHMEALSYDFKTRKVDISPASKVIFSRFYPKALDFINDALKARIIISQDLRQRETTGDIPTGTRTHVLDVVDDIIRAIGNDLPEDAVKENNNNISYGLSAMLKGKASIDKINQMNRGQLAQEIARVKQGYVILDDEGPRQHGEIKVFNHRGPCGKFTNIATIAVEERVLIIYPDRIEEITHDFDLQTYPISSDFSNCDIIKAIHLSPQQLLAGSQVFH